MKQSRPNIILINCDDLGYGDLGCYGSSVNKTPAVDRLAAEGVRFTDFYMGSPVCSPSRGAMLTGCYPRRIGFGSFAGQWVLFPGQAQGLNPEETTIAGLLKQAGYATMLVGKWHCGDQQEFLPTRHGFDRYYGLPFSNDMGRQASRPGRPPRRQWPPLPLLADEDVIEEQPDQTSLTERYVEQCVRFMREKRRQPFFLYFAHMHVHLPHYTPDRFLRQSENGAYGAAVECIDWAMAVILDELERLGLKDNTIVMFTSDNGSRARGEGGSNGPLRGTKGTTWEGGMRVPCIVRWPGRVPAGSICSELTSAMDFLPTIAHITDQSLPDNTIDGRNVIPLWLGQAEAASPHGAFFYYHMDNLEAVRSGPWKLHLRKQDEIVSALYNLTDDMGETNDVLADHPDVASRLQKLIDACRTELGDAAVRAPGTGCRVVGEVANPVPLTQYDPDHPYIVAMYDKYDAG